MLTAAVLLIAKKGPGRSNENHEASFMTIPFRAGAIERRMSRYLIQGALQMKWETPEAIDFRFGMEITMYVSNR